MGAKAADLVEILALLADPRRSEEMASDVEVSNCNAIVNLVDPSVRTTRFRCIL
jgi:hypothetical protein